MVDLRDRKVRDTLRAQANMPGGSSVETDIRKRDAVIYLDHIDRLYADKEAMEKRIQELEAQQKRNLDMLKVVYYKIHCDELPDVSLETIVARVLDEICNTMGADEWCDEQERRAMEADRLFHEAMLD